MSVIILLVVTSSIAVAQIPKFNSNSSATAVAYIDFDGHTVKGTSWNWDSTIHARPSNLKQAAITEIFNRVSEDYRIFNINITTDSSVYAKAPVAKRIRIIVTPTNKWYGVAGGVSYIGSFAWGDGTPSWVFSNILESNPKFIGEAVSHELGHTLGLQHQSIFNKDCDLVAEYAEGKGEGEIGWAPIMGNGYYKNLTTWSYGTSAEGCAYIQSDIDVITTGECKIPLRSDDHANTRQAATAVTLNGSVFASNGMINSAADKDVFKIVLSRNSHLQTKAMPSHVSTGNAGANLDIKLSLLRTNGDTIGRYNPLNLLSASIDTNLVAGTYYVVVDGIANTNLPDYGSIGYFTLDGSIGQTLPITKLTLNGRIDGQSHQLSWSFMADEPVKEAIVETSEDGIHFSALSTQQPAITSFTYRPFGNGSMFYRLKMVTVQDERAYYSNIISLQYSTGAEVSLFSNLIAQSARVNTRSTYAYQVVDVSGRILQQGTLTAGTNTLDLSASKKGLLFLKVFKGSEQYLFRLIKQ